MQEIYEYKILGYIRHSRSYYFQVIHNKKEGILINEPDKDKFRKPTEEEYKKIKRLK